MMPVAFGSMLRKVAASACALAIAAAVSMMIPAATIAAGTAADGRGSSGAPERRVVRADIARIDDLLRHVQARLDLAPKLAESKWISMTRIEDSEGEEKLLATVRDRSPRLKLEPEFAASFARAQIEAAKSIQASRHRQWALDRATAPPRNVQRGPTDVAWPAPARIDAPFDDRELEALRDAMPVLKRPGGRMLLDARAADLIQVGGADLIASQIALEPLYRIAR